jgi:hypothetical protein
MKRFFAVALAGLFLSLSGLALADDAMMATPGAMAPSMSATPAPKMMMKKKMKKKKMKAMKKDMGMATPMVSTPMAQ